MKMGKEQRSWRRTSAEGIHRRTASPVVVGERRLLGLPLSDVYASGHRWPFTFTLERCVALREVNADNRKTDRILAVSPKLFYLSKQIADHPVNLLYHRLG